jgi:uncharacterized membrane protein
MVHAIQVEKKVIMNKTLKTVVWLIMATPLIYLSIVWKNIPSVIPVHYDLKGTADRFGDKTELLLMTGIITVLNLGVYLLLINMHRIDPKRYALENKDRILRIAFAVSVFISAFLCMFIYNSMFPGGKFMMRLIFASIGLLFSFIGNYMHNIKPNYFAGIRLPWTLENEENWRKTHLLGGKLFFAAGLLITISSLLLPLIIGIFVSFVILLTVTIIPVIYSYRLYKKQKNMTTVNKNVF